MAPAPTIAILKTFLLVRTSFETGKLRRKLLFVEKFLPAIYPMRVQAG